MNLTVSTMHCNDRAKENALKHQHNYVEQRYNNIKEQIRSMSRKQMLAYLAYHDTSKAPGGICGLPISPMLFPEDVLEEYMMSKQHSYDNNRR